MKNILAWAFRLCFLFLAAMPDQARGQALRSQKLPEEAHVSGTIGHPQSYNLSCESRSAVDWAGYWDVSIGEWGFLSSLPLTDNPDEGFVGTYNGAWGNVPPAPYGVHARPVATLLRQHGLRAKARLGLSWKDLRTEIAAGRPVIIWVIGTMWPGTSIEYTASNGHKTTVAAFEHTMIATGYDSTHIYAIDASTGYNTAYTMNAFLNSWAVLGNMAVTGQGPKETPTPTDPAPEPTPAGSANLTAGTYTVQRGDYLIALARRFGMDWQELARINTITYPYTVHPGQVLKLPTEPASQAIYLPFMQHKPAGTPSP